MRGNSQKTRRSNLILLVVMLICVVSVIVVVPETAHASAADKVMKMLKYYKNGEYAKADAIGKKLSGKKANEKKYRKALSSKAKSVYAEVLESYKLYSSGSAEPYMWNYFVKDLDGKGMPELCMIYGSCEADVQIQVFRFKNNKAYLVATDYCAHSSFSDIPGKKGVVVTYGHMGSQHVYVMTLKNNKLKYKDYNGHSYDKTDSGRDYKRAITFPYAFPEHVTITSDDSVLSMSGIK